MRRLIIGLLCFLTAWTASAEPTTGPEVLAFVRSRLPDDPIELTGSLRVRTAKGRTRPRIPVRMSLDWGAPQPVARYEIGSADSEEIQALDILWKDTQPRYTFTGTSALPTDQIQDTGITWADLSFSVLWWPNAILTGNGNKIGRDCYIVDVPVPNQTSSMRLWIWKKMGMLLEVQTLDEKQKTIRSMKITSVKKLDGMWVAKDLEIKNKASGNKTILEISDLKWTPREAASSPAFDPAESLNRFSTELYRHLAPQNSGNLFLSPYSIATVMAMAYGGAAGETAAQMEHALHFEGQEATHPGLHFLRETLTERAAESGVELNSAQSLWPRTGLTLQPDYLTLARTLYNTELRPLDYATDAEAARKTINQWVEDKTRNRIKNLIPAGMLSPATQLVLANAIYFKGQWANRFRPEQTRPRPFHLSDGTTTNVPMMTQSGKFSLAQADSFQAMELPYQDGALSMLILLPTHSADLSTIEQALSTETLDILDFHPRQLILQLPRFKLETAFDLTQNLAALGMPLAFSPKADFSGITGAPDLFIDAIVHKAFIEVNEEGTEAAAATALGMRATSLPPQFIADRPFLFLIRENKTNTLLFIGRLANPAQ